VPRATEDVRILQGDSAVDSESVHRNDHGRLAADQIGGELRKARSLVVR
jgi:hypothetical protein